MKMKMKLQHMGYKPPKQNVEMAKPAGASQRKEEFPELRLHDKHMAGLDKLQRGDKCQLVFQGEVVGTENYDNEWRGKGVEANFKLMKGAVTPTPKAGEYKTIQRAHQAALEEQAEKGE